MSMTMLIGFLYYRNTPARASCTIAQGHSPSLHVHLFHAVGDDYRTSAYGVCVYDAHPIIRQKAQNKGSSALRVPVSAADRIGIAVGRRGVRAEACARAKHQRLIGLP